VKLSISDFEFEPGVLGLSAGGWHYEVRQLAWMDNRHSFKYQEANCKKFPISVRRT